MALSRSLGVRMCSVAFQVGLSSFLFHGGEAVYNFLVPVLQALFILLFFVIWSCCEQTSKSYSMVTGEASLGTGCGLCKKPDTLKQCCHCKAIRYCSREHQIDHRDNHDKACAQVARKEQEVYTMGCKLRIDLPGALTPQRFVPGPAGMRLSLPLTRDYLWARYGLVAALGQIHTRMSVELQLGHFLDMLKLSPCDTLGVRFIIPGLMMRLGQDQECYNFIKCWERHNQGLAQGNEAFELPYLKAPDSDNFESVDFMCHKYSRLDYTIHATLLKIRLLLDLMALRNSEAPEISDRVPQEILDIIQVYAVRTNIVAKN